jgi:hypothetical protein
MEQDRRIGRVTELVLGTVAAAPALYWWFTDSGPFRLLLEWEQRKLGWSSDKLTLALLALPLYVVLRTILIASRPLRVPSDVASDVPRAPGEGRERLGRSLLIAAAAAVAVLGMAAWIWGQAASAGELRRLDAADFEAGRVESYAVFAEVRGAPGGVTLRRPKRGGDVLYFPLGGGQAGRPFALVVEVAEEQERDHVQRQAGNATVRGIGRLGSLEPAISRAFGEAGIALAARYWVLRPDETPARDRRTARFLGMLALPLFAFVLAMRRRFATA